MLLESRLHCVVAILTLAYVYLNYSEPSPQDANVTVGSTTFGALQSGIDIALENASGNQWRLLGNHHNFTFKSCGRVSNELFNHDLLVQFKNVEYCL